MTDQRHDETPRGPDRAAGADAGPLVALFGEFGIGNIGNDESCRVMVDALVRSVPGVRLVLMSRDADGARRVLGMDAEPIGRSWPTPPPPGVRGAVSRVRRKVGDFAHLVRAVGRYDAVVVPGTGVLEARRGRNPGGVIVWLLLLSVACRLRRVRLAWFAVGGSSYDSRIPARVAAAAARGAGYRSYRDDLTRRALARGGLGTRADAVTHDIVMARPAPVLPPVDDAVPDVALAAILQPADVAGPDYLERMADLAVALSHRGARVRLVVGDAGDHAPTKEVLRLAAARDPQVDLDFVPTADFSSLVDALAPCAVVVASRFHVLLAGLHLRTGVIALSHAEKDDELLWAAQLEDHLIPIDAFTPQTVADHAMEVARRHAELRADLDVHGEAARRSVLAEIDRMVSAIGASPAPRTRGLVT
ncbi:polysaccharide pyruvyl transferase family protein [Mumia sp. DW29H23]|uniref:polysaccharide pyruvyl transferase family protein n=1 Tax=Mumia sp. DW29H23 TaxID=3421241 RepID=UPI003D69858B